MTLEANISFLISDFDLKQTWKIMPTEIRSIVNFSATRFVYISSKNLTKILNTIIDKILGQKLENQAKLDKTRKR